LDSKEPSLALKDYIYTEGRYRILQQSDPKAAKHLLGLAQQGVNERWKYYKQLSELNGSDA
jgi:pyruvate-ferredoxin/flavodoxin oxidoreductase